MTVVRPQMITWVSLACFTLLPAFSSVGCSAPDPVDLGEYTSDALRQCKKTGRNCTPDSGANPPDAGPGVDTGTPTESDLGLGHDAPNTSATAEVPPQQSGSGLISSPTDIDCFKVHLTAGQELTANVRYYPATTKLNAIAFEKFAPDGFHMGGHAAGPTPEDYSGTAFYGTGGSILAQDTQAYGTGDYAICVTNGCPRNAPSPQYICLSDASRGIDASDGWGAYELTLTVR